MCDFVPGELLGCYPRKDQTVARLLELVRTGQIGNVRLVETFSDRLAPYHLKARPNLHHDFVRLEVPPYEEMAYANTLLTLYGHILIGGLHGQTLTPTVHGGLLGRPEDHLQLGVNSVLSVCGKKAAVGTVTFSGMHQNYQKMFGWTGPQTGVGITVLILDTGVYSIKHFNVKDRQNFLDINKAKDVTDEHNHGTAIASIIEDLCPSIPLIVYKVADEDGNATEWDVLAGLGTHNDAKVINISLAFGLKDRECPKCGRASHSSRSKIFETLIGDLEADDVIIIAAAGNKSLQELAYPARFKNVLAIESINNAGNLSDFSNHSDLDHDKKHHEKVFVLPGGQEKPVEFIATASDGTQHWGTSFATAYATAIVAATWSKDVSVSAADIIQDLKNKADITTPKHYNSSDHGNGLMVFK